VKVVQPSLVVLVSLSASSHCQAIQGKREQACTTMSSSGRGKPKKYKKWEVSFAELVAFKKKHGHLNVRLIFQII